MSFDLAVYTVGLEMRKNGRSLDDRFNILSESGVLDDIYAYIASGGDLTEMYLGLGVSEQDGQMLLKRTPKSQQRYIAAMTTRLAENSLEMLSHNDVAGSTFMSPARAAGAKHHRETVKQAITANAAVISGEKEDGGTHVTVIATTNVGTGQTPPPLPKELQGVTIDASKV